MFVQKNDHPQKNPKKMRKNDQFHVELLTHVIDSIPTPLYLKDLNYNYVLCNKAFANLIGSKKEQIIGKSMFDVLGPELASKSIRQSGLETLKMNNQTMMETKIKNAQGLLVDVVIYKSLFYSFDNEPTGIIGSIVDISKRKKAERLLLESEERWKFALEGFEDGVWDYDPTLNTVFYSSQWKKMLGYSEEEVGNSPNEWLSRIHPEDLEHFYHEEKKLINNKIPYLQIECRLRCKDESYKWVDVRGKVVKWTDDGMPLRIIGTHTDISVRKKMEEEKSHMHLQLEQSSRLAAIGTLAAGVAHEINNPLTIISTFVQALSNPKNKEKEEEFLYKINSAIKRIENIVKGLTLFSRRHSSEHSKVNIHELLTETYDLVGEMFKKKGVLFELDLSCKEPVILSNAGKIQQIVMNLISNAKDAILEVRTNGMIKLSTMENPKNKNEIQIIISDDGCGMNESKKKRIFDAFYTTKAPGKGTGLGLSITLTILECLGGRMVVESLENVGSTFIIYIPKICTQCKVNHLDPNK